jgi:hypothetical protein
MLYQLAKDRNDWLIFVHELKQPYRELPLTIGWWSRSCQTGEIDEWGDMTIILCVDGLQKLVDDGMSRSPFNQNNDGGTVGG